MRMLLLLLSIGVGFCSNTEQFHGTVAPTEKILPPPATGSSVLTSVRASAHEGWDRIVFEFAQQVPSFRVEYIQRPFLQCGSGEEVQIKGAHLLQVSFSVAQGHDENGHPTVKPVSIESLLMIEEMRLVCDFEGEVTFLLGVRQKKPYRILLLESPSRLALDIQN
jgi:hypothetical protein